MKSTIKKIGALALALVIVLAMGTTAFAADMTGENGVIGEFTTADTATVQNDTVVIYKEITAYNPETCTVNAPTITFNYAISAGAAGMTITDAYSHHNKINDAYVNATVKTKAGVGTPTITGITATGSTADALAITPEDKLDASKNGTANRFGITIDFTNVSFTSAPGTGAGVYRYVISETTEETTKKAAGIKEGTGANTLYMDVYVNGDGKIYGYVLFTDNEDINASPNNDEGAASAAGKTEGFVGGVANGTAYSSDTSAADRYYTFNLELKKVVRNDQYAVSTKHQFPFTVTLDNSSVSADVLPVMTISDTEKATQLALTATAIGTGTTATKWEPTIADGATIKYVGIPCGTTITVYETNDVTGVTYTSVSENADTNADAKPIGTNEKSNTATVNCGATALNAATENHTESANKAVTFTNTLLQISPTGVVMRVGPYLLIVALGAVLFLFTRRRKVVE